MSLHPLPGRDFSIYRPDDGREVACADCKTILSADAAGVLLGVERCAACERRFALRALIGCDFLTRPPAERLEILSAAEAALHNFGEELRSQLRHTAKTPKCAACKCMPVDPLNAPCCSGACRETWDTEQRLVQLRARAAGVSP